MECGGKLFWCWRSKDNITLIRQSKNIYSKSYLDFVEKGMFEAPSLSGLFSRGVQCRGSVPEFYRIQSVEELMPMILQIAYLRPVYFVYIG
jgi:hypothetical protein